MVFCRSKDLDCYEKGGKKMGFGRSKDLILFDDTKKNEEKSWVSHEVKIWIVIEKEEKRWGFAEVKIWIVMKKGRKKMGFGRSVDLRLNRNI